MEETLFFSIEFRPYCGLDLEDRNPNFLYIYDTPDHDDTPTYQVSLQQVTWFRRYHQDKILFPEDLNLYCDLDVDDAPQCQIWLQKVQEISKKLLF